MCNQQPTPEQACTKPVLERKHAQAAAKRMRQRDKTVVAYRCQACDGWHVGGAGTFKPRLPNLYTNHQPPGASR